MNRFEMSWSRLLDPVERRRLRSALLHRSYPLAARVVGFYRLTLLWRVRIAAVVGSFGKTTTTGALRAALGRRSRSAEYGNRDYYIARSLFSIRPWHTAGVVEVGVERPGEMARHARMVQPDLTIVTSIGSEHSRSFPDLAATRLEKSGMVSRTRLGGTVILNGDDPNVLWMKDLFPGPVITAGFEAHNRLRASDYRLEWPNGSVFQLHGAGQDGVEVRTGLLGRHHVQAVLGAVAAAIEMGVPLPEVLENLSRYGPRPMRLQPVPLPGGGHLLRDEFKSPWETIDAALDVLGDIPARRRWVVMGEVTEPPRPIGETYRRIGRRMAECAHEVLLISRNSHRYRSGARQAGFNTDHWTIVNPDFPLQAVAALQDRIAPGDVVLIKGRAVQRLQRISLALLKRPVTCGRTYCNAVLDCSRCPLLDPP